MSRTITAQRLLDLEHLIEKILKKAVEISEIGVKENGIRYSSISSVNEEYMVDCLKDAAVKLGLDPDIIRHVKGHAFPDVMIKGSSIGIELKGTKTGLSFNGNSVIGSTFVDGVKKVYLYYWVADQELFGFVDYFDAVIAPVVTHSPRFRLKIDLKKGEGMFGNGEGQIGLAEDVVFSPEGINADKIINWMRYKAELSGQAAWWMVDRSYVSDLPVNQGLRIGRNKLSDIEKKELLEKGFLYFPELLSVRSDKFNAFISWAISLYGVVLNRDFFTAGGTVTGYDHDGNKFTFSQIYNKYLCFLDDFKQITLAKDDIKFAYGVDVVDVKGFCNLYIEKLLQSFDKRHVMDINDNSVGKYHVRMLIEVIRAMIMDRVRLL